MATKKDKDFFTNLPAEVKEAINKAKSELDCGEGIPHEQVMAEIKERYRKIKTASQYKTKVLNDIEESVKELKLVMEGKLTTRNAEDLFNEL